MRSRSFVHLFIHLFTRSIIHLFIRLFIRSFVWSFIHLFDTGMDAATEDPPATIEEPLGKQQDINSTEMETDTMSTNSAVDESQESRDAGVEDSLEPPAVTQESIDHNSVMQQLKKKVNLVDYYTSIHSSTPVHTPKYRT